MNFDTTLTRYLRNFDPINESLFNVPNQPQQELRDNVITQQDLEEKSVDCQKDLHFSQKSLKSAVSQPKEDYQEVLTKFKERELQLIKQNEEQQNKLHLLAEHVSALEFQNQQIAEAMKKSNRLYKSMKTSREGSKAKIRSCDRCFNLNQQIDKVTRLMESFIGQFSSIYLKQNDDTHPMCDNFRKLLTKNEKIGFKKEVNENGIFAEVSEWMLTLFEQIDFQTQLNDAFRQKVDCLITEGEDLSVRLKRAQNQRNQALSQLEMLNDKNIQQDDDEDDRLCEIIRLSVEDLDTRHKALDFLAYSRKKKIISRNISKMCKNLQDFQQNYGQRAIDNSYNAQVRFKQNMISKEKTELSKIEQSITRIYKSIICNLTVRQKQNSLRTALQSRQSKTNSLHKNTNSSSSITTSVGANRLFDQIIKKDQLNGDLRQNELSRQNSLLHLKKKIQDADTLSRMMSSKNIRT